MEEEGRREALRREGFTASNYLIVCSQHFKQADFDRTGEIVRLRRTSLSLMLRISELLQVQLYVLTYRFSQDHLELLFNSIRASGTVDVLIINNKFLKYN